MAKKRKRKKDPRGRKPVADKIVAVTAYIYESQVKTLGGIIKAKLMAYTHLNEQSNPHRFQGL
jgi:hypothetical protein